MGQGFSAHNFRIGVTGSILSNFSVTVSAIVKSMPEGWMLPFWLNTSVDIPWELNGHILYSPIPSLDLYASLRNFTNHAYYGPALNGSLYPMNGIQASGGVRFMF